MTDTRRARGELRRRAILDATLTLVGRMGAGAITHRAVAEEAGVPLAATTYYFSSKSELVREALTHAADTDRETTTELARALEQVQSAEELARYRLHADVVPGEYRAEALADSVEERLSA